MEVSVTAMRAIAQHQYEIKTSRSRQKRPASLKPSDIQGCGEFKGPFYAALYNCRAEGPDEISFPEEAILTEVVESAELGWLFGKYGSQEGLIPENYVIKIDDSEALMILYSAKKRRTSTSL